MFVLWQAAGFTCVGWRHEAAIWTRDYNEVSCRSDIHYGCIWNYKCGSCFSLRDDLFSRKLKWYGLYYKWCDVGIGSVRCITIIITGEGCSSVHWYFVVRFVMGKVACDDATPIHQYYPGNPFCQIWYSICFFVIHPCPAPVPFVKVLCQPTYLLMLQCASCHVWHVAYDRACGTPMGVSNILSQHQIHMKGVQQIIKCFDCILIHGRDCCKKDCESYSLGCKTHCC